MKMRESFNVELKSNYITRKKNDALIGNECSRNETALVLNVSPYFGQPTSPYLKQPRMLKLYNIYRIYAIFKQFDHRIALININNAIG